MCSQPHPLALHFYVMCLCLFSALQITVNYVCSTLISSTTVKGLAASCSLVYCGCTKHYLMGATLCEVHNYEHKYVPYFMCYIVHSIFYAAGQDEQQ